MTLDEWKPHRSGNFGGEKSFFIMLLSYNYILYNDEWITWRKEFKGTVFESRKLRNLNSQTKRTSSRKSWRTGNRKINSICEVWCYRFHEWTQVTSIQAFTCTTSYSTKNIVTTCQLLGVIAMHSNENYGFRVNVQLCISDCTIKHYKL